jgi:hypothetical protein
MCCDEGAADEEGIGWGDATEGMDKAPTDVEPASKVPMIE